MFRRAYPASFRTPRTLRAIPPVAALGTLGTATRALTVPESTPPFSPGAHSPLGHAATHSLHHLAGKLLQFRFVEFAVAVGIKRQGAFYKPLRRGPPLTPRWAVPTGAVLPRRPARAPGFAVATGP